MIARIGASTEKQPFTAHAQGMSRGAVESKIAIPKGKGMPIRIPAGMTSTAERAILTAGGYRLMAAVIQGSARL